MGDAERHSATGLRPGPKWTSVTYGRIVVLALQGLNQKPPEVYLLKGSWFNEPGAQSVGDAERHSATGLRPGPKWTSLRNGRELV